MSCCLNSYKETETTERWAFTINGIKGELLDRWYLSVDEYYVHDLILTLGGKSYEDRISEVSPQIIAQIKELTGWSLT